MSNDIVERFLAGESAKEIAYDLYYGGSSADAQQSIEGAIREEIRRLRNPYRFSGSHEAVDAFWKSWQENGEPHKHGIYESTWMAFAAAIRAITPPKEG